MVTQKEAEEKKKKIREAKLKNSQNNYNQRTQDSTNAISGALAGKGSGRPLTPEEQAYLKNARTPPAETKAAEDLAVRQEEAKGILQPQQPTEATQQPVETTVTEEAPTNKSTLEEQGYIKASDLGFMERANTPAGQFVEIDGEKYLAPEGKGQRLSTFGNVVAGSIAGTAAGILAATQATLGFLNNAYAGSATTAARGSRALGTNPRALGTNPRALAAKVNPNSALYASSKLKGIISKMGTASQLLLGGSVLGLGNQLLTSNVRQIESQVTKAGEQLTKIPEAATLGFSIDEEGNLFEYTPEKALQNIEEVEQSLIEAEEALQSPSIGKVYLKITGRYLNAQLEIDKQRREIVVARGKVLTNVIANPSPALLASRDFFRGLDLE